MMVSASVIQRLQSKIPHRTAYYYWLQAQVAQAQLRCLRRDHYQNGDWQVASMRLAQYSLWLASLSKGVVI